LSVLEANLVNQKAICFIILKALVLQEPAAIQKCEQTGWCRWK